MKKEEETKIFGIYTKLFNFRLLLFFASFLLLGGCALCEEIRIRTVKEFLEFSENVRNDASYSGLTVFLDSDMDLSETAFGLIGESKSIEFLGSFNGQGYVISNLAINSSSSSYVGLFGYSRGATIKDLVMDSSCSVASSFVKNTPSYVGSVVSRCYSNSNPCIIESIVNMASVSFNGNITSGVLYLGGIAGYLFYAN